MHSGRIETAVNYRKCRIHSLFSLSLSLSLIPLRRSRSCRGKDIRIDIFDPLFCESCARDQNSDFDQLDFRVWILVRSAGSQTLSLFCNFSESSLYMIIATYISIIDYLDLRKCLSISSVLL